MKYRSRLIAFTAVFSLFVPLHHAMASDAVSRAASQEHVAELVAASIDDGKPGAHRRALLVIEDADEHGYSAEVVNGSLHQKGDSAVVENDDGA